MDESVTLTPWQIEDRITQWDTVVWPHFSCMQSWEESHTEHNYLSIILNLNEHASLTSMVYEFECCCSASMSYVTVISRKGGTEKVDDHACIFWRSLQFYHAQVVLNVLIDTFALVLRRGINLCFELLWHAPAFNSCTLAQLDLKNSVSKWSFRACYIWHWRCTKS